MTPFIQATGVSSCIALDGAALAAPSLRLMQETIRKQAAKVLPSAKLRERFAAFGVAAAPLDRAGLRPLIQHEIQRNDATIKRFKIELQ